MSSATQKRAQDFVEKYWRDDEAAPKHERLRRAFAESLADGFWTAGMRLPTEAELVAETPCSLGTIQRALRALADEGLIERRQGSGSVVTDLTGKISDPWHIRYLDASAGDDVYQPIESWVVRREELAQQGEWSRHIGQKSETVIRVDRIFRIGGGFNVYVEFYAIAEKFPEFVTAPLASLAGLNFKTLIAQRYKAPTHKARQHLRFAPPPEHVRQHCGYEDGAVAPVLNVVAYTLSREPIYYQDFYLPLVESELDLGFVIRQ